LKLAALQLEKVNETLLFWHFPAEEHKTNRKRNLALEKIEVRRISSSG
jgi:hypothetical protein